MLAGIGLRADEPRQTLPPLIVVRAALRLRRHQIPFRIRVIELSAKDARNGSAQSRVRSAENIALLPATFERRLQWTSGW